MSREWVYATGFAFSALVYFPVGWMQFRSSKKICEDVIHNQENWHEQQSKAE
jgi:hypothetical protein